MFKLISWLLLIASIIFVGYAAKLFFELSKEEREQVKMSAGSAVENGILKGPLADKLKEDLAKKKAWILKMLQRDSVLP